MQTSADLGQRFPAVNRLGRRWPRNRVPVVRQLASVDCGAAALAMVIGYFGKSVSLQEIRNSLGSGRSGATAASILRLGRSYGLRGRGVRVELEDLDHIPAASILYWEFNHFVVFEGVNRNGVEIVDPSVGRRKVPLDVFRRAFTGVALIFEATDSFEPSREGHSRRIFGLFGLVLERKGLLVRIISMSALVQILSMAMPLLTGVLIDRVIPHRDYQLLGVLAIGYCVCQLSSAAAGFVRSHLLIHLRTGLEAQFTLRFLDHLVDLPYSFFQQHTSGDLMVRLGSNTTVRDILTTTTLSAFMDGTMATLYLTFLAWVNVPLTLIVIFLAVARFALLAFVRWRQRQIVARSLANQATSQTYQVEMLSGMETLKAMGLEHQAVERWSNIFVDGLNLSIQRGRLDAIFDSLLSLLGMLSTLALMFYGAYLVLQGTLTLGTMMAFTALAVGFLTPLNNLVSAALQLQLIEVYLERLNDVMDAPREQDDSAVTLAKPLQGAIALESVFFRYGPQEPIVLEDVTMEVSAGSRVALVGRTGSGKSTLARLMAALYDPESGKILFDTQDLRSLDRRSIRTQLGIVTQETQLFGGSIRGNIGLADPGMPLHRIIRAAKLAAIHDEIIAMPMGYDTLLTDRGLSLSGGQRQRLAIARAVATSPKVLILDEATSHLDAVTEAKVNENLASLRSTRIVIAHRLSTIRDADLIVVLDAGRIAETGTHGQLLSREGAYAELVRVQKVDATDSHGGPRMTPGLVSN
jgi:ATP-binding cassette subfamily B protein